MGCIFQLTYDEFKNILGLNYFPTKIRGYSIPPGMYEIIYINFMLKNLLPKEVKVYFSIDDVRLNSILNINQLMMFTRKSFFIQF